MKILSDKSVGTLLGITFICLFTSIYIAIGYSIIDRFISNSYGSGYERIYIIK